MKQPTTVEAVSAALFGSEHFAAVTAWVADMPVGESHTFIANQISEAVGAPHTSTSSVLGRLASQKLVIRHEPGEWEGRNYAVPYSRNYHKLWTPLRNLCEAVLEAGREESTAG